MPELPEVETIVKELRASAILGISVTDIRLFFPGSIRTPTPSEFQNLLHKDSFIEVQRRGKYIHFTMNSGNHLILHLRMSGHLSVLTDYNHKFLPEKHDRVLICLQNKNGLLFTDQRKFGRFDLVKDPLSILGKLGVEPLSAAFTPELLNKLAENRNVNLKTLLLDQSKIAGIGNIYADEALFYAGIHPLRPAHSLQAKEAEKLHSAIIKVLQQGIKNMGTSLGTTNANFYSLAGQRGQNSGELAVFRRNNQACFHCGELIQKIRAAGRGTHFCPKCQT